MNTTLIYFIAAIWNNTIVVTCPRNLKTAMICIQYLDVSEISKPCDKFDKMYIEIMQSDQYIITYPLQIQNDKLVLYYKIIFELQDMSQIRNPGKYLVLNLNKLRNNYQAVYITSNIFESLFFISIIILYILTIVCISLRARLKQIIFAVNRQ